jgi:hypothetical protein
MTSFPPHDNPIRKVSCLSSLSKKETKAQRDKVFYPSSHGYYVKGVEFNPCL